MCGIAGFTGSRNRALLERLLDSIKHRGYDDRAEFESPQISIGLNRLAIVDLSKGLYPMIYKNFILVYNGEIYNFRELRKTLIRKGVEFRTNCDAEVILPLFDLYGSKSFAKLEGMFAIAIYDKKNNQLILARDKSGEKPLYHTLQNTRLYFSSELKSLLTTPGLIKNIDRSALFEYLRHGSIYGEKTLVENFRKIPPSHYLIYDLNSRSTKLASYWQPVINERTEGVSEKDLINELDILLRSSVESRLLSDVPLGTFLSGGVDSSLITYFAGKKLGNLKTYSVSFPDFPVHYDESKYSRLASDCLNTDHTEVACRARNIKPLIEDIENFIDEPIDDPAFLPTKLLANEARKSLKVVLAGEGGDELFGGYYRYHKELLAHGIRSLIKRPELLDIAAKITSVSGRFKDFQRIVTPLSDHYSPLNIWSEQELKTLLQGDHRSDNVYPFSDISENNPLLFMQLSDYRRYLSEQVLMKSDKACMTENLELRSPYLDTKIINFALSLPGEFKIRGVHGKYILRKVAEKYLPKKIVWRLKKGFSVPLGPWFRKELKSFVVESLNLTKKYSSLINYSYFNEIVREHMSGETDHKDKIWTIAVLIRWIDRYRIGVTDNE